MPTFLERIRAKMTGSLSAPTAPSKPEEKSRWTVHTNRWDERTWKSVRQQRKIDSLIADLDIGDEHNGGDRKGFDAAPELIHDTFMAFYKAVPTLLDKRQIHADALPARKLMEELLENPKLKELQDITVGQTTESTIALLAMEEVITDYLARIPPPPPPPQPKNQPQPKSGGNNPQSSTDGESAGAGQGEGGEQDATGQGGPDNGSSDDASGGAGGGGGGDEPDDLTAGDQEWQDYVDDYESQIDAELDMEHVAHRALEAAQKQVDDLDKIRKGIGLGDGEWLAMSPEERLQMAERLRTKEMKNLAEIVGRMKRFAMGIKATRVNDVPEEIYDVENGNDITRVIASEFALLATRETTYEFYRRYADHELLQYRLHGTEDVGKGPIVIAIDKSGSMSGEPFNWAMGVAESIRRFAAEEDRDYYAMFFGNNKDRNRFEFPKGKAPFEKVLSFLSVAADGGTQFDGVLTEALAKATTAFDNESRDKADIVFVTDGMAELSEKWIKQFNEERRRVGVRMYSVYIGGAVDMGYGNNRGPLDLLDQISDAVIPVKDLRPESASLIFQRV